MTIEALDRYYGPGARKARVKESGPAIEDLLPGEIVRLGSGSCFVTDSKHPGDVPHGHHPLGRLRTLSASGLAVVARDAELQYLDLSHAVFLDTETTGLGMGTGTYVFLVGAGYLDGSDLRVRQFFLRGPGDEVAFLSVLRDFLSQFSAIVSFNGRAFDWPMIEGRFLFRLRSTPPLSGVPHLDLLYPARRVWKTRLESCALSSLEQHVLGVRRSEEDVPGWQIPALYFAYQRSRDGRPLRRVFYHNLHDILSLATLAIHIDHVMSDPASALIDHPLDLLAVGKAHARAGDSHVAAWCFEEALGRGLPQQSRIDCLVRLAALQKRQLWWRDAIRSWERLLEEGSEPGLFALVERAKYHEHVERDYDQAIEDVRQALLIVEVSSLLQDGLEGTSAVERELEHRLMRLYNRRTRSGNRSRR